MSVERNKETARRFYEEVLNEGNLDLLDELAVPDYETHDPLPGQRTGLVGLKDRVNMLREGMAPRFTIQDIIAEGDKVVVRWTNSGKMVGEFLGMPANGKTFTIPGIDIYRVQGDKLAEHWHVIDALGQMMQIGLFPAAQSA
jgi:steroid delta-isomerase-like uncharacterized protein